MMEATGSDDSLQRIRMMRLLEVVMNLQRMKLLEVVMIRQL